MYFEKIPQDTAHATGETYVDLYRQIRTQVPTTAKGSLC